MSLENALETAKQVLDEAYMEAEGIPAPPGTGIEKKKKMTAGGEGDEVEATADGKTSMSADGVGPKIAEPLEKGSLGKATLSDVVDDDLSDMEGEEELTKQAMKKSPYDVSKMTNINLGMKEALEDIFAGSDISEDLQDKLTTVFETAVELKVDQIRSEMFEEYEATVEQEKEHLASKVDEYLSYVVENWMSENQVAIDHGIRSDVNESFMRGLKDLFEQHYVSMPDEKFDVVEGLNQKVEELTTKLDESIERNVELSRGLIKAQCEAIYETAAKDFTSSDEERFRKVSESIEFDSAEEFANKLNTLKEHFFGDDSHTDTVIPLVEEMAISEEEELRESVDLSPSMSAYTNMLSRINNVDNNKKQI